MKSHSAKIMVNEGGTNYFAWSIITDGFMKLPYTKRFLGVLFKLEIMMLKGEYGQWASDTENIFQLAEATVKKIEAGTFAFEAIERLHKSFGRKVVTGCRKLKNADKLVVSNIKKVWEDFIHLNCLGFIILWADLEYGLLTKRLTEILQAKGLNEHDIQKTLSLLITPTLLLAPWQEKKELLHLAIKYKSFQAAINSKDFRIHSKKFQWLQYGYQGPELKPEYFAQSLKKNYKDSPAKQLKKHLVYFGDLRRQQKMVEHKLGLMPNEKRLFIAARKIMYLKAYRVDVRHYFHWIMDDIFKDLSIRYQIPFVWFHYAERKEILKLIKTGRADIKKGMKRSKFLLRVSEGKKIKFIEQKQANEFLKKALVAEKISLSSEITGNVAFPGKVTGIVRIVNARKDIRKVNKNDILVSLATNPDLLPTMYKAVAFVTDAGGITSHAAIVAREFKKPCIIGTKIATKVLKDGDLIEVDANRGVVRKI